jgi:hypothetical protein
MGVLQWKASTWREQEHPRYDHECNVRVHEALVLRMGKVGGWVGLRIRLRRGGANPHIHVLIAMSEGSREEAQDHGAQEEESG